MRQPSQVGDGRVKKPSEEGKDTRRQREQFGGRQSKREREKIRGNLEGELGREPSVASGPHLAWHTCLSGDKPIDKKESWHLNSFVPF